MGNKSSGAKSGSGAAEADEFHDEKSSGSQRFALCIGNSDYKNAEIPKLKNPGMLLPNCALLVQRQLAQRTGPDARDLGGILQRDCGFDSTVLLDLGDRDEMEAAIDAFAAKLATAKKGAWCVWPVQNVILHRLRFVCAGAFSSSRGTLCKPTARTTCCRARCPK